MSPQRIQLSRAAGWRMPVDTIKADRTGKWGNPFRVVKIPGHKWSKRFAVMVGKAPGEIVRSEMSEPEAIRLAVDKFRSWAEVLVARGDLDLEPLRGKNLACWCKHGAPCHADVLLELANRE